MDEVSVKLGILGSVILLLAGFVPLAYVNQSFITFFPVYDNFNLAGDAFAWRDISAFAVTFGVTSILSIIFLVKKKYIGIFIVISLNAAAALFSLAGMVMLALRASHLDDLSFRFSYGWIFIVIGIAAVVWDSVKIRKVRLAEKAES